jgi:hypothetical protein
MALVGLVGALTGVTAVTMYVLVKAGAWQLQADANGMESDAPRVVLHHTLTAWKGAVAAVLVLELWPGLSSWAYDAWHWILANVA